MKKSILLICVAALTMVLTGCDDFLDITPTGKVIATTGEEYRALLTYEYKYFPKDRYLTTVRTDEVVLSEPSTSSTDLDAYLDLWRWKDDAPATTTSYFSWRGYYHTIYIANYIIEHRDEIKDTKAAEVNQLVGEAYMLRAYCHFILVNLYAQPYTHCDPSTTRGIPLMVEADVTAIPGSSSVAAVYETILADVDQAAQLLNVDQWDEGETYRFNTISAKALRSRVCLYMGRWQEALDAANEVIAAHGELQDMNLAVSATGYMLPNNYKSVESIVALEKYSSNENTVISHPEPSFVTGLYRSGDQRRTKYFRRQSSRLYDLLKDASDENVCSFRSAEAYLNAAEASVQLGKSSTEIIDILTPLMQKRLNATALTTTVTAMSSMTQDQLLQEVYDERARELAFEGHRWFDLRRTTMQQLQKTYEMQPDEDGTPRSETYTLEQGDSRYTMRFPTEAVEANPEIERW